MENMEQNKYQKMEKLQNSMATMLLHTLDERFLKGDIGTQGNHENKDKKIVEPKSHTRNILKIWRTQGLSPRIMIIHHSKIYIIGGLTWHQETT
jgi:hypothetical protein